MKLVAILRIKDEILHIEKCLSRLTELVDEIIILDNGSTDGTLDIYPKFNKITEVLHTEGFDEGRDKILLLEAAKKKNPDWIMWLDGDEVFENHLNRNELDNYMNSSLNKVTFRLTNFWMDYRHVRIDGKFFQYSLHPRSRMWRNIDGSYFRDKKIHNGEIEGVTGPTFLSPYRLLHYGYVDIEKVSKKYDLYKKVDKVGNRTYEHIKPDAKVVCLPYIEFKSKELNYIFILSYKYVLTITYLIFRVFLKISLLIKNKLHSKN